MRTKSFPARSLHKSSRKSLDPFPSPSSLPDEANERFGSGVNDKRTAHCDSDDGNVEMVPDTFDERHVPQKKRHCRETDIRGFEPVNLDACIVCDVLDELVSHCSGSDCLVSFHAECLKAELGCGEDLANSYCPYCWFKILALKSKSLSEKAVGAEKAVFTHLDKEMKESVPKSQEDPNLADDENGNQQHSGDSTDIVTDQELQGEKDECSSKEEHVQVEKDSGKSRDEDMPSVQETDQSEKDKGTLEVCTAKSRGITEDRAEASESEERVVTENFQDAEVDKDDETGKHQTKVNTGTVKGTDDSPFSGKEHNQVQHNEKQRRRRRLIQLSAIDSEISSNESTNEQNGEYVTEQFTSSTQVNSPSRMMKKQERKFSATTTKVAKSNTVRDISFFKKDQRKRLFWTFEEEEMLKVGVEKFAAEAKRNMPWRKILEMGEKVFHETRTPADLKDKWRNMIGGRLGQKTNKTAQ